jgi:hypothetical protein
MHAAFFLVQIRAAGRNSPATRAVLSYGGNLHHKLDAAHKQLDHDVGQFGSIMLLLNRT